MTYKCELDARGWQLYASSMDCTPAVIGMNNAMNEHINSAFKLLATNELLSEQKVAQQVVYDMKKVLRKYMDYGAGDSEPECALCYEVEHAFKHHLNVDVEVSRW